MGRELQKFVDAQLKFDYELVQIVRQYEWLYNINHQLYDDEITRRKTWEAIASMMGKSGDYCEIRWDDIINRFHEELRWQKRFNSASFWLLFTHLGFLKDSVNVNWQFRQLQIST